MKLKRSEALKWTCKFGSILCKSEATEKLLKWFDNPETNALPEDDKDRIMCAELSTDDQKLWKKVKPPNIFHATPMSCISNISFLENHIFRSITKNPTYTEFSYTCRVVYSNTEHGVTAVLNFINNHYKELTNLNGYSIDKLKNDISILAIKIRNKKQRDKLKTFIESNKVSLNGALDRALAYVDKELKIIDKELHPFKEFFDNNMRKKSDNSTDID
ncbi:hypothetical protein PV327_001737 [Microctonus hyperodae]|uniref:Uncharacterized protein n=1 Tax=Microctonus hyperodae TaxID=165561 RepID=A0AA39FE43_MICHY|nr:hypothetical protein PV327_001737 [Microctonus hyperodae]